MKNKKVQWNGKIINELFDDINKFVKSKLTIDEMMYIKQTLKIAFMKGKIEVLEEKIK